MEMFGKRVRLEKRPEMFLSLQEDDLIDGELKQILCD